MSDVTEIVIKYDERGPYCEILLTQGQVAKVSPEDYVRVSQHKWYARWGPNSNSFYAMRTLWNKGDVWVWPMARFIKGLGRGASGEVDHINHDTLDNRRNNLRVATRKQNSWNCKRYSRNTLGYRGVVKWGNKYAASTRVGGKRVYGSGRLTPVEAFADYVALVKKHHGEFAPYA